MTDQMSLDSSQMSFVFFTVIKIMFGWILSGRLGLAGGADGCPKFTFTTGALTAWLTVLPLATGELEIEEPSDFNSALDVRARVFLGSSQCFRKTSATGTTTAATTHS